MATLKTFRLLLLGSGGREHAFAWKLAQSKRCAKLFIAPGNAGTLAHGQNVQINPLDFPALEKFVIDNQIDMVIVGPEEPLVRGIWDYFQEREHLKNIPVIGPSKAGAVLEGSKAWSKKFMLRHKIPTAGYQEFTAETLDAGLAYLKNHALPIVLKADGLAAGKGVVICQSHAEAEAEMREMLGGKFGASSARVVVEEFLTGIEFSVFALTDGKTYKILPEAKDYKRIGEGDTGPNTGGMGAVSPVLFVDSAMWTKVEERVIRPTVEGLKKENIPYKGFIFFGFISVNGEPFVIEYNCRMGDPETEVVLPRLKNDLVTLFDNCARGTLGRVKIRTDKRTATTVFLVSGGYPGNYEKGKVITGLDQVKSGIAFQAGTAINKAGECITAGGRVIALTSLGKDIPTALRKSNRNAMTIQFEGKYFRRDIGKDLII
ncbi:MAG: phosphoribosylamine--glycine ligase [Saprospiraceae bacterium]|nr:phosphoribosylamine--glycine ligase [Saprospiraceae bacterium]